jgi:hydroxyacid-oxoacid transhydrogenase
MSPERHLRAAQALGADTKGIGPKSSQDAGAVLAARIIHFMRRLGMPNGLSAVGYNEADIPALVAGTLPQHRVTKLSPRLAGPDDLATLFRNSMRIW